MYKQYGVGESDNSSAAAGAQVSSFPTPVKLNVGGKTFQTTMTTLQGKHAGEQDSMLAAMFSGRHPNCLDEGNVFIDRDGNQFAHLMEYLRSPAGKIGYFENLRAEHVQSMRAGSRNLGYEQMLDEARYFQLKSVLAVLLPPVASFGNASSYGILRAPEAPAAAGNVVTRKWEHQAGSNTELYEPKADGAIRFHQAGTYLIMAKVPGVSSGNNGYGQLVLDGAVTDEVWGGNQHGYRNMLGFNRVMSIPAGGQLQVQGTNLTHAFNMGRELATSLSIVPLRFSSRANVPFVSLRSHEGGANGSCWRWKHREGSDTLLDVSDDSRMTFAEGGVYLVLARVSGVSTGNSGHLQLALDDQPVAESWAGDPNGYHRMLYFNEVLEIPSGGRLQLKNMSLNQGYNMNRPQATDLTAVRLGASDLANDGLPDSAETGKYARFSSTEAAGNGFWSWSCSTAPAQFALVAADGNSVTITNAGTYLIMARVPGCSSSNNGYAQLTLDGAPVQESWANDANGYHAMLHFNHVLKIAAGGQLQLQSVNLSHNFNLGRPLATSLTVLLLATDEGQ